jgi:hypothetical protein
MRFKDFVKIFEAKQVGFIFHFTTMENFEKILSNENLELLTLRQGASFTRNFSLPTHPMTPKAGLSILNGYRVRLTVDGDKLSDRYHITPIAGAAIDAEFDAKLTDVNSNLRRMKRSSSESEELVIAKNNGVEIGSALLRVDVIGQVPAGVAKRCSDLNINLHQSKIFPKLPF